MHKHSSGEHEGPCLPMQPSSLCEDTHPAQDSITVKHPSLSSTFRWDDNVSINVNKKEFSVTRSATVDASMVMVSICYHLCKAGNVFSRINFKSNISI